MKVQWFKVHSKTDRSRLYSNTPCKQIKPLSRVKSLDGPRVRVTSPVGKEKVYMEGSEWNTERVREDASGDSKDGEDDELPYVIGESAARLSDEARGDQWGVHSIDKVQHT